MATWFTAVAPFLPDIIQMAKPIFTRSMNAGKDPGKDPAKASELVSRQIAELQDAAAQNADAIHKLAEEMQNTIASLREASVALDRKLERANRLALIATTVAVLGFAVAAYALAA